MQVSRVLCPVDFSGASHEALHFASDLARQYNASLTLLHVYNVPGYTLPDGFVYPWPGTLQSLFENIDKSLADWRKEAEERGVRAVDSVTVEGSPWRAIVDRAREGEYSLIVVGSHGHGRLHDILLGSVAERVVQQAPCPVLTVHENDHRLE